KITFLLAKRSPKGNKDRLKRPGNHPKEVLPCVRPTNFAPKNSYTKKPYLSDRDVSVSTRIQAHVSASDRTGIGLYTADPHHYPQLRCPACRPRRSHLVFRQ